MTISTDVPVPCQREGSPNLWTSDKREDRIAAKQKCEACPERLNCLREGSYPFIRDGVWGGLTASEREAWRAGKRASDVWVRKSKRSHG